MAFEPWVMIALWGVGLNLAAFLALALDKRQARRGGWRVSERSLLTLAFLGGWPGAKLAQRKFRHKTRKQPFRTYLNLAVAVWVAVAVAMAFPDARATLSKTVDLVVGRAGE